MFSKGDYQRYLFEIGSTQPNLREIYNAISAGTNSDIVRPAVAELLDELTDQEKCLHEIEAMLPVET